MIYCYYQSSLSSPSSSGGGSSGRRRRLASRMLSNASASRSSGEPWRGSVTSPPAPPGPRRPEGGKSSGGTGVSDSAPGGEDFEDSSPFGFGPGARGRSGREPEPEDGSGGAEGRRADSSAANRRLMAAPRRTASRSASRAVEARQAS